MPPVYLTGGILHTSSLFILIYLNPFHLPIYALALLVLTKNLGKKYKKFDK